MKTAVPDRIEKQALLRAPRARVWRAVADAREFGRWFGVELSGAFTPGARLTGKITHPGYEHYPFEITVERMEPEALFSFRWHPNALDLAVDYSAEPTTLIEFRLQDAEGGTLLTLVESGFERLPASRLEEAYRGNEKGWAQQMEAIARYVAQGR
jgi:uncharacterized protein YndB with AHSA1/START domain